ncbi:hypothetical protein EVAR_69094_1 [Eumeta japonica]|uniref:Uncharacterized protein n=1 Tax=Eumeta variegata TaxID=151549 RepID=A0A4C1ZHI9_EUMVA|nr:hypothetical protein EVAR_69094_1 [Eumeta japonica]
MATPPQLKCMQLTCATDAPPIKCSWSGASGPLDHSSEFGLDVGVLVFVRSDFVVDTRLSGRRALCVPRRQPGGGPPPPLTVIPTSMCPQI